MDERARYIIITHRRRTLLHFIGATLCLLIAVFCVYLFIIGFHIDGQYDKTKPEGGFIEIALTLFAIGLYFLTKISYIIDAERLRYKREYSFLKWRFGRWRKFKSIDYVAVFKKKEEDFRVKLWYNKNKHFSICTYYDKAGAMEEADLLASRLNVNVWDATNPNDGKWR